jgi:hypothetical protein
MLCVKKWLMGLGKGAEAHVLKLKSVTEIPLSQ